MSADEKRKMKTSEQSSVLEPVIPEHLKCPLTGDLMIDPVGTPYGHFYDRWAIDAWLDSEHATDPLTREFLCQDDYIKFYPLNEAVEDEKYGQIREKIIDSRNEESLKQLLSKINQLNQSMFRILCKRF